MADAFREQKSQSDLDREQMDMLTDYIASSSASGFNMFDNFPKYVQRSALSRFLVRYEVFKKQLDVHGSIIELGVGRGGSLMTWAQLSTMFEPVNYTREIVGFDTFEGVPAVDQNDESPHSSLVRVGGFGVEADAYEDIQRAIDVFDMTRPLNHLERVKLVKGDICETLPAFLADNPHMIISLLYIDVDLYQPTKVALELLSERLPKGGIILFDELNTKFYPGETVATAEVLGINSLKLKRFPWSTTLSYSVVE